MMATSQNGSRLTHAPLDISRREMAILGTLLDVNGSDLPPSLTRLLEHAPESFGDMRCGRTAAVIGTLRKQNRPVDCISVSEMLANQPDFPEPNQFVGSLAGEALTLDLAELEAGPVLDAYRVRRTKALLGEGLEALNNSPAQMESIVAYVEAELARLGIADEAESLTDRLSGRCFDCNHTPPEPVPRYLIGSIPICTPGNVTVITGPPKAAKTALVGAFIAAAVATGTERTDCLGILSRNPDGKALIHLDTEQSCFDHHAVLRTALRRAGVQSAPAWLLSYFITGFTTTDSRSSIRLAMDQAAKKFGGIHSVLLDGAADCVANVNDPDETNGFVNELQALAIEFDCPIITVIHLNPGSESKTRGHLGSQLERKAETNLQLVRDGNAIVLWADKNRRAPIPKYHGPCFQWSHEHMMHVSVASIGDAQKEAKLGEFRLHAQEVFMAAGKPSLSWSDFIKIYAQDVLNSPSKTSTARKHFEKMIRAGIVKKNPIGHYELA